MDNKTALDTLRVNSKAFIVNQDSSELTFKDIVDSNFGRYVKIVYNGDTIYDDIDDGLYLDHEVIHDHDAQEVRCKYLAFLSKYEQKKIYNFYCRVVDFHHTELYIEGEVVENIEKDLEILEILKHDLFVDTNGQGTEIYLIATPEDFKKVVDYLNSCQKK